MELEQVEFSWDASGGGDFLSTSRETWCYVGWLLLGRGGLAELGEEGGEGGGFGGEGFCGEVGYGRFEVGGEHEESPFHSAGCSS